MTRYKDASAGKVALRAGDDASENTRNRGVLSITQKDRDVAADIHAGPPWRHDRLAALVRSGKADDDQLVRAAAIGRLDERERCATVTTDHGNDYDTESHAESASLIAAAIRLTGETPQRSA